jgi:hypothetical protein
MATMTAQGTLPSAGGDMTAAPVTNTINHVMNTYNGNNIDENNVDYTNSDGVMVLAQAQTRTAALTQKATFTVGVDDTGHDVQFFGASSSVLPQRVCCGMRVLIPLSSLASRL